MDIMTAFPESESDRLNTFLDACVRGQRADPDGLDPALADTYERISALNAQSVPDSALMTDIWRRMMNTSPITSQLPTDSAVLRPAFARPPDKLAHNRGIGRFVTAFALLAVVLASVFGYRWYTGGSDPQPGRRIFPPDTVSPGRWNLSSGFILYRPLPSHRHGHPDGGIEPLRQQSQKGISRS